MYSQLPMFHRVGAAAYKANLDNTIAICNLLNDPHKKFKSIHIGGTNGKGSTSHMLASVLQEAGYKVGLYTSPHLKDFRERIRVNGKMISKNYVVDFVEKYKTDFEKIQPSFFEMTVGLAFQYFADKKVDVAVIEVGLGGRLDSTNVIDPDISVITNISYDHMALLGNTLPKIAEEKAGIIKKNGIVVIGESQLEVRSVFIKKATEKKATIVYADKVLSLKNAVEKQNGLQFDIYNAKGNNVIVKKLLCTLRGVYQQKNILTVMATLMLLEEFKKYSFSASAIKNGFKNVIKNTSLKGRWQILSKKPLIVADTGHNEAGIKEVLKQIKSIPHKKLHIVFGIVNDKDAGKILKMLPQKAVYYFCKADIPRALEAKELALQAAEFRIKGDYYSSVKSALRAAKRAAKLQDFIFIGGSTFVVAEAL